MFSRTIVSVCICLCFLVSSKTVQGQPRFIGTKEITDQEQIADIKALLEAYQNINKEREACYKVPADRQECICDKYTEYVEFSNLLDTTMTKYPEWYEYVLIFNDNGQKKRISYESFLYENSPYNHLYQHCWFPKTGGMAKAIHDQEIEVLRLVLKEDIYDIRRLQSYSKKVHSETQACIDSGYEASECSCAQTEGYELLEHVFNLTREKHPDWEYKTLQFSYSNTHHSIAFNQFERHIIQYKNDCSGATE